MNQTITVNNVKQKIRETWVDWEPGDTPIKGPKGYSLKVGYKNGEEWENYYLNDPTLFDKFAKGATLTVEYEQKGNFRIIKSVNPTVTPYADVVGGNVAVGNPSYKANNGDRDKHIALQTISKCWSEMYAGKGELPMPSEFAANVLATYNDIFEHKVDMSELVDKAVLEFDAVEF